MARRIITALDIGSSTVEAVAAEFRRSGEPLRILGIGIAPSRGVRRGAVVDIPDTQSAVREALHEAEKSAGSRIKSVWLTVGGAHTSVASSKGVVAVSRADGEISREDVRRAMVAAESFLPKNSNREIIHMIPRDFRVDDEAGIKDPVGMHGVRLEVDTLMIEVSSPALKNLLKCVRDTGLEVEDYVFAPLAAAEVALSKRQRELGVVLLDIGGDTAHFIVFEEGVPLHAGVIPLGGNHITNDVAIGFRTQVDVAERVKLAYGSCLPHEFARRESIRLAEFVEGESQTFSRRQLAEIIIARLRDIFELLEKELKKIDRSELLPAGVVLVGGSALHEGVVELTKREMKLPVELGVPHEFLPVLDLKHAPQLVTVLGALKWAEFRMREGGESWRAHSFGGGAWVRWLRSFLP